MDIYIGKPKLGLILRTPTKWEPKQDMKPNEVTHRANWNTRASDPTGTWEDLNAYATAWSREYAGEQKGSKGGNITTTKSPYLSAHGNGGEALIGESRLIAATRRRLEALCRAFRQDDQAGIAALRKQTQEHVHGGLGERNANRKHPGGG